MVNNNRESSLSKIAMFVLALYPLLHWYDVGLPIGLGSILMLFISFAVIAKGDFNFRVYPFFFLIVWIYVLLHWYKFNFSFNWMDLLPGGIIFFIFAINFGAGIALFNIDYLKKYMRIVVILAIVIFLFQFLMLLFTNVRFCFVPNLTGAFTYENMTYSEIAARHLSEILPCAFFLEKSYMAYYLVIFLVLELFYGKGKEVLFSKLSIVIFITLLLLRSGSGLVGMVIPVVAKCLSYSWNKKSFRYPVIVLSLSLISLGLYLYVGTDLGASMLNRKDEITTEGTSGFSRIMYGYIYYERLDSFQKLFGISVSDVNDLIYLSYADKKFALNGIQAPLIQLGAIGLMIWIMFYLRVFISTNVCGKIAILCFFILSAIEVTYLGPYMLILSIIPSANMYQKSLK